MKRNHEELPAEADQTASAEQQEEWGPPERREPPPNYFGRQLKMLRESYNRRVADKLGTVPLLQSRTSIAAVVACMKDLGYPLSIGAWSELENGINQPRNGLAFLDAVERCLRLTQEQRDDLLERLAFDTLFARFGSRITQLPYLRVRNPAWE